MRRQLTVRGYPVTGDCEPKSPAIVPYRKQFLVVRYDERGTYDDTEATVLPRSSPWFTISKALLRKGGYFVEMVQSEEFAETLLRRAVYRPTNDVAWFDLGEPLACVRNVSEAAQRIPSAAINIGLGLHYSDGAGGGTFWCRHTFLTIPVKFGTDRIYEVTVGPWGYYGFPANDRWWRFWVHYAGARLADE